MHIDRLAAAAAAGADAAGGKSTIFGTITVSDGISMGTPGMRYSLVSREVIADSIETVVGRAGLRRRRRDRRLRQEHARLHDGDRAPQPAGRLRLWRHDPARRRTSATSSRCSRPSARTRQRRDQRSRAARGRAHARFPGPGSCGGMYTANTMASAIEALGMSLREQLGAGGRVAAQARRLPGARGAPSSS